ncbi:hypothetical protein BH10BDE1_BH10BDE1_35600 [soil metagenome]
MTVPFSPAIESALLTQLGGTPRPKDWAKSVQKLSNHYVAEPDSISPWSQDYAREALLSYFHPLNQARANRVASKGAELGFFDGLDNWIDVGCGSGAASLGFLEALNELKMPAPSAIELSDHSHDITMMAKTLNEKSGLKPTTVTTSHQSLTFLKKESLPQGTLLILSYVLTESAPNALSSLIKRLPGLEAVALLEPSTSQDARRLQALRPVLIEAGFQLWAPCTHHDECPLLKDSDRDWCHDRLIPKVPSWWTALEADLPMKNKTVTVSYLLARRKPRAPHAKEVRVIGDRLDEKTKVRQMICRGDQREFLSWFPSRLKQEAETFYLARGDRFNSDDSFWKDPRGIDRSREWRLDLEAIRAIESTLKN